MRNKYPKGSTIELIMKAFCDIVMPEHTMKPKYGDIKKICARLNVDIRTYYNWKNAESAPHLNRFIDMLDNHGYEVHIVKKDSQY